MKISKNQYLTLIFFLFIHVIMAQDYFVFQKNNQINLYDMNKETSTKLMYCIDKKLVGCKLISNNLKLYFTSQGIISDTIIKFNQIDSIPEHELQPIMSYELTEINSLQNKKYKWSNYTLDLGFNAQLYNTETNSLLWLNEAKYSTIMGGPGTYNGYSSAVFSPDCKFILFKYLQNGFFKKRIDIVEFNVEKKKICNVIKKAENASYSPSGRFVMYDKYTNKGSWHKVLIYDKLKNEIIDPLRFNYSDAFWIRKL